MTHIEKLKSLSACQDGFKWASKCKTAKSAWESCERPDWLLWYLRETNQISTIQSVRLAVSFAERVLSIFEAKFPEDKRPRLAIESAVKYIKHPSEDAADAAYAAACAADAADAAACAAHAAARAAYAADAAACAARAAARAADAADAERKWQCDRIREMVTPCFDL